LLSLEESRHIMFDATHFARLQSIGLTPSLLQSIPPLADGDTPMRVVEVQRDSVLLHDGGATWRARLLPALHTQLADDADGIAVGDWVLAQRNALAEWWVRSRVPPANQIARTTAATRSRAWCWPPTSTPR
jgi:ribosome biogenesis GTPase